MHTAKAVSQGFQGHNAALTTRFFVRFRQGSQKHGCGYTFQGFGQVLHKAQVGVKRAAGQVFAFFKLADIGHQFVDEDDARRMFLQ